MQIQQRENAKSERKISAKSERKTRVKIRRAERMSDAKFRLADEIILAEPLPQKGYRALTDGKRLFLRITPEGGRAWRLKYKVGAKESQTSLGAYPTVSID
jgi:hypothetical protein